MAWTLAVVISGLLAVWGKVHDRLWVHWVTKPLTTALILGATAAAPSNLPAPGRAALCVALALSLAGDVLLMLPQFHLAYGLASFLAAHVAYVIAFSIEAPWRPDQLGWLAAPALAGVLVIGRLWPHLGRLRPAVVVYVVALCTVAWRLLARHDARADLGVASWTFGATGAALFLAADALLALRRFKGARVPYVLELGSYFAAQYLIASSTWG